MKIKSKKKIKLGAFQWSGGDANRFFLLGLSTILKNIFPSTIIIISYITVVIIVLVVTI